MLLFSYGSNSPVQLRKRLGHSVKTTAAKLPGHKRVCRGWSKKWGGGVASVIRKSGNTTYGGVTPVSKRDLRTLDRFEGVHRGKYRRVQKAVRVLDKAGNWKKVLANMYVATSRTRNKPSKAYLAAVRKDK